MKKILITGGCGFLGSNLAARGVSRGDKVTVLDNLSRAGVTENLEWLKKMGVDYVFGDIRNQNDVEKTIQGGYDWIFHTAAQTAMTTSLEDPRTDFDINALGTFNILEAVRKYCPKAVVIYSSTNKVYGDLERFTYKEDKTRYVCNEFPKGFDETLPLDFSSNYGCSKGAADQFAHDYNHSHGLNTIVFRHSAMYGGRQFATNDQGWIGWFCQKAIEKLNNPKVKPFTIHGNGKQVRDILFADDVVDLYYLAAENYTKLVGKFFNVGGGLENSLSLLELFAILEKELKIKMEYTRLGIRPHDQKVFVANSNAIRNELNWKPKISAEEGVLRMIKWLKRQ